MLTEQEFTTAADRHLDMLYHVALNCLRFPADAEDAVQETMLRLWRTETPFENDAHLRNWLVRVCVNVCRDMTRSPWKRRVVSLEACGEPVFPEPAQQTLWSELMALPARDRLPLYLHYYEGYSTSEIGTMLGLTATAIRSRLMRARSKLKLQLEEESE